jgi:diphosphomevalonate decarboxylase
VTTAVAHPNIALVKYWGKVPEADNIPASPSLSITLDTLRTQTKIETSDADRIIINGKSVDDEKITKFLAKLRRDHSVPPLTIDTDNNFPTGAGLASSASGFAALITAINAHCRLGLSREDCSTWARRGSGSAARSLCGGFSTLTAPHWHAQGLLDADAWPLRVVIAITDAARKSVSSTAGMERSRLTSPFYAAWLLSTREAYDSARQAVLTQNFDALATIAQASALNMHAVMLSSQPPLMYWNAGTMAAMQRLTSLREQGVPVFFTIDAGPQIKAVCQPDVAERVERILHETPGILGVTTTGLGPAARVIDA